MNLVLPEGADPDLEAWSRLLARSIWSAFASFTNLCMGPIVCAMWLGPAPSGASGSASVVPTAMGVAAGATASLLAAAGLFWIKSAVDGGRVDRLRRGLRAAMLASLFGVGGAAGALGWSRALGRLPSGPRAIEALEAMPLALTLGSAGWLGFHLLAYRVLLAEMALARVVEDPAGASGEAHADAAPDRASP